MRSPDPSGSGPQSHYPDRRTASVIGPTMAKEPRGSGIAEPLPDREQDRYGRVSLGTDILHIRIL